jgi:uncharacterized membrane protein
MRSNWVKEGLFWLHFFVILGGILMGLVLPWWLAISAVIVHRVHLRVFDGCALSRLQKNKQCLAADQDYLQEVSWRLFGKTLDKQYVKLADKLLVSLSLLVIAATFFGYASIVLVVFALALTTYGIFASKQLLKAAPKTCDLRSSCREVTQSAFNTLAGIKVELLGIVYFSVLVIAQILLALNNFEPALLQYTVSALSITGLLFSLYFIVVQARVLKSLCQGCMNVHGATFSLCLVQSMAFL